MLRIPRLFRHAAVVPATIAAPLSGGIAFAAGSMSSTTFGTQRNLRDAMHGEAYAYLSYMNYGDAARARGNATLAKLFDDAAITEHASHFAGHAAFMHLVGSDSANLREAISGENYENTVMYPDMAKRARASGDAKAADWFDRVGMDEGRHRNAVIAELKKTSE